MKLLSTRPWARTRSAARSRRMKVEAGAASQPRCPLDRNARNKIAILLAIETRTVAGKRGKITPTRAMIIVRTINRYVSQGGRCDPSHATIAAWCGHSESTVKRAFADAEDLGVVTWAHRWKSPRRGVVHRTSNAYAFRAPLTDVQAELDRMRAAAAKALSEHKGQVGRGNSNLKNILLGSEIKCVNGSRLLAALENW